MACGYTDKLGNGEINQRLSDGRHQKCCRCAQGRTGNIARRGQSSSLCTAYLARVASIIVLSVRVETIGGL